MLKEGAQRKTRQNKLKTFLVCWGEQHTAELEASSEREVRERFWELVGEQLAEDHPHLTFEESEITKVEELAGDGDASEKDTD